MGGAQDGFCRRGGGHGPPCAWIQARDRLPGLHPQFGLHSGRCEPHPREQPLDVTARVTVAAVPLQTVFLDRIVHRVLERDDQLSSPPQRPRSGRDYPGQVAEIPACQPTRSDRTRAACSLGTPSARPEPARRKSASPAQRPASRGQVDAGQSARERRQEWRAEPVPQPASRTSAAMVRAPPAPAWPR